MRSISASVRGARLPSTTGTSRRTAMDSRRTSPGAPTTFSTVRAISQVVCSLSRWLLLFEVGPGVGGGTLAGSLLAPAGRGAGGPGWDDEPSVLSVDFVWLRTSGFG